MTAWLVKLLPAVAVLGLAAAPAPAVEPPAVKDDGQLFTDRAEKDANAIIADIERRFKKDVRVEGYNQPPADKADDFQKHKKDKGYAGRFFKNWAEERLRATGTNGVLILIYRDKDGYFAE